MCRKRQPPAQARTEFPQWMVGTDIDGRLPVTLEMDPKSKVGMGLELMKLINFLEECSGCRVFLLVVVSWVQVLKFQVVAVSPSQPM